jgi:predicted small metal-binding protein
MKKTLACADLGVPTCTFEARSEQSSEIVDALLGHAGKYHPEKVNKLSDKEKSDMITMMKQKIG